MGLIRSVFATALMRDYADFISIHVYRYDRTVEEVRAVA